MLKPSKLESLLFIFSAFLSLTVLAWLLRYSGYGIDFTDEGFYLNFISNPFLYSVSLTQFGFIYHPLYQLLGGDISSLRQANIVITFFLSWYLINIFLQISKDKKTYQKMARLVVGCGFSAISLLEFSSWLLTPSYNSLVLQALLISSIGLALTSTSIESSNNKKILGWVILGFGGFLVFMAKSSSALGLAVLVFAYFAFTFTTQFKMMLVALATSLLSLCTFIFFVDSSILRFVDRIRSGIDFAGYLGGRHTLEEIVRWDEFALNTFEKNTMLVGGVLLFSLVMLSYFWKKGYVHVASIFLIFCFSVHVISAGEYLANFSRFKELMIWMIIFPMIAMSFVVLRQKIICCLRISDWGMVLVFLVMPYVYVFGTNNNYWSASGSAAFFWIVMGVILLRPLAEIKKGWSFVLPLVLATQVLSVVLLQTGWEKPYRQPQPLRLNEHSVEIGSEKSKLVLSEGYAAYLESAIALARNVGLIEGTPVIDVSGQSPAILYAIGAEAIGQAWTIGGYPGSQKLAEAALARVSCEKLSSAWLLVEDKGPRSLPLELLESYGAMLPTHFQAATSWWTAQGAGGYKEAQNQVLYKPIKPDQVLNSCNSLRGGQ